MRNLIIIIAILTSTIIHSQNDNVEFENLGNHLYKTEIIEVDSISQNELQNKFKKITSRLFVNLDKVIVNETGNQIVMNFILTTNNLPKTSWNVRIISEFKDSRMRLKIYDLGNVFIPSGQHTPTWNESSIYVTDNKRAVKKNRIKILNEWMNDIDNLILTLKNELNKPIQNDEW